MHFTLEPHDPDQVLHCFLQIVLNLVWVLAGRAAIERTEGRCCRGLNLRLVDRYGTVALGKFCGKASCPPSEYDQIRKRISAQPICAVQSCRHFSRGEKPGNRGHLRIAIDADSTHHVMSRGTDLHRLFA